MSRRKNLGTLLFILLLDFLVGFMWYIVLFPSEPTMTIETVGATLMTTLFTAIIGFANWTAYQGCISDD